MRARGVDRIKINLSYSSVELLKSHLTVRHLAAQTHLVPGFHRVLYTSDLPIPTLATFPHDTAVLASHDNAVTSFRIVQHHFDKIEK